MRTSNCDEVEITLLFFSVFQAKKKNREREGERREVEFKLRVDVELWIEEMS